MSDFNPTPTHLREESDRDGLSMARDYLKTAYAALNLIRCDTSEGRDAIDEAMMKVEEAEGIISYQWAMFGGHDLHGLDKATADMKNAADEIAMILRPKQAAE
jgi:hypothetical protein